MSKIIDVAMSTPTIIVESSEAKPTVRVGDSLSPWRPGPKVRLGDGLSPWAATPRMRLGDGLMPW
jgi:hypothetical protein